MTIKLNNKDYIWSYIGVFVSIGSSIIMLPFILYFLNSDMYGLWSVFQSVSAITTLFDFGFSTTFARNINYCWCGAKELKKTGTVYVAGEQPNFLLMKRTIIACRYIFLLLSAAAFLFMLIPGTLYIRHISTEIAGTEPMIAWGFYVLAVFFNLYYGYYNAFLRGVGAVMDANRAAVFSRLLQIILTVVLLMIGFGIIGTGIAYLSYGFIFRILSKRAFLRFKGIGFQLAQVTEKTTRREIQNLFVIVWHNASKEGIVTLSNYLANQACTLIIPLYMTLSMTGIYSLAVQLTTILSTVASTLYTANQPVLQSAYITKNMSLIRRTMSLIIVSYVVFYLIGMGAIIIIGLPILRFIKSDATPTISVLLGVGLYQFILKFRNCYTSYFSCTNRILYACAFIISSVAGVCLAWELLHFRCGIWGLIIAQIVSQGVYNVWYWPIVAHKEMQLGIGETVHCGWIELKRLFCNFVVKKKKTTL